MVQTETRKRNNSESNFQDDSMAKKLKVVKKVSKKHPSKIDRSPKEYFAHFSPQSR